ncbi:MAG: hypothetical protein J6R47_02660, partial [Acholeplasmatales bacterium]|nr:hypothetical protein [Acholeplasmatales bacterium]
QELVEARKPKGKATISEIDGEILSIEKTKAGLAVTVKNAEEEKIYSIDATAELLIKKGSQIKRGQKLMKGSIAPKELLRIMDAETVQKYIVEEVQKVYRSQSVEISDKHIEIIVRQMMRKLIVVSEGDTDLLPGREVSLAEFNAACREIFINGGTLPTAKPLLLGITKAALASDSFLSASSFQETTRILTSAAIQSKSDSLLGLKENVIIGGLIPAGTGVLVEESFECEHAPEEEKEESVYANVLKAVANTKSYDDEELDEDFDGEDLEYSDEEIDEEFDDEESDDFISEDELYEE